MTAMRSIAVGVFVLGIVGGASTSALAQTQGIVIRDRSVIWRAEVSVVAATVPAGTVLTITAERGEFYEVIIPEQFGGQRERGRISKAVVELLSNTPPLSTPKTDSGTAQRPDSATSGRVASQRRTARAEPLMAVRGFGQVAYTSFTARQSFEAMLGESHGVAFGAGAQVRFRSGPFVEGSWERFKKTGHQVFVFEETVYELDTPNTITITPLTLSGGYRFRRSGLVPFAGAGLSQYRLQHTTPFTTEAEDYDESSVGYHATIGVEFKTRSWVGAAVELRYTSVPDALGTGGVSEMFNERNLGGVQAQFKLLIGR